MLDLLTAAAREVKFGGETYKLGALKMRELGLLQRWLRDHAERPTVRAKRECEFLDPADHAKRLRDAADEERDNWPPSLETREGNKALMGDPDGRAFFLAVMFRKYQPDITDEKLDEIMAGLSADDFGLLTMIAFGADDLDPEALRATVTAKLEKIKDLIAAAALPEAQTGDNSSTPSSPPTPE